MALTEKQKAMLDSCPVLKSMKSELIAVLGGEEESSEEEETVTTPKRSISVTVTDGTDPVNGASVVLTKSSETIASSTTGSSGGCTLQNVEDGTYTLTVTKDGFTDYTSSVTTSENNTTLSVELTATTQTSTP
jgi:hypothetical protein